MIRKFRLINGEGASWDLNARTSFFHSIGGFGYKDGTQYEQIGTDFIPLEELFSQGVMTGRIFFGGINAYKNYRAFSRFVRAVPLTLVYEMEEAFRVPVRMTEIAKSELITGGAGLDCEVAFTATGLFYKNVSGYSGTISIGGKIYPYEYTYAYDKVGPEYVINEEQAETVRRIFDLYLAGNGYHKIMKQLEKEGRRTAMGKTMWHYATVGHILKNRLYCGELEYRKEYVPDYLEQKRAKNKGELERVIVEGKHQPIVTKEEFGRVQKMMAEKDAQMGQRRKNKGVHSDDLWRRKMRCQCGHAFAKTKWHTKTDFITYTYKCYDQTRTGTIAARLKNGLSIENVCRSPLVQDWKMYTMAQKVLHAVFDDPEGTLLDAAAVLGCGIAGVEQSEVLRDKEVIEEQLKKERGRYETLLDMRMNNEIPKEVFSRKQQEVGERIAELEQRMAQYGDVEPATEADVSGKLENLQKLMGQFSMPEDGEFSEEEMDKYVSGVRVYEDRFEWLLNLSPDAGGGLDDAGSPVYFKKITVTPDDERAWFRKHPQWSKSNRYAELEVWIFI
ncbi:hypothetical protein C809_04516 [Lachnospiraceae bacterium MD335]|nr:hypothetical protein C809_04516 [Lachnospiraceae bacterium MD335]